MEKWITYALILMFFAGFTSVIAKMGLAGISGELGLTIRTLFVCDSVLVFAAQGHHLAHADQCGFDRGRSERHCTKVEVQALHAVIPSTPPVTTVPAALVLA